MLDLFLITCNDAISLSDATMDQKLVIQFQSTGQIQNSISLRAWFLYFYHLLSVHTRAHGDISTHILPHISC